MGTKTTTSLRELIIPYPNFAELKSFLLKCHQQS